MRKSLVVAASGQVSSRRRRRRHNRVDDVERRANRTLSLVQMGEISRAAGVGGSSGRARNTTNIGFVAGFVPHAGHHIPAAVPKHRRTPA